MEKNERHWDKTIMDTGESWENVHVLLVTGDGYCDMCKGVNYWFVAMWSLLWIGPCPQGLWPSALPSVQILTPALGTEHTLSLILIVGWGQFSDRVRLMIIKAEGLNVFLSHVKNNPASKLHTKVACQKSPSIKMLLSKKLHRSKEPY